MKRKLICVLLLFCLLGLISGCSSQSKADDSDTNIPSLVVELDSTPAKNSVPVTTTPGNSREPTSEPTPQPTPEPTPQPTPEPTPEPTPQPTPEPTPEPTPQPTPEPTPQPTPEPTPQPTPEPTPQPTPEPTPQPTPEPTPQPTPEPTPQPTPQPTNNPAVREYVLNKNTMKFHYPSCNSVKDIKDENRWDYTGTREEIIDMGYDPCKRCHP